MASHDWFLYKLNLWHHAVATIMVGPNAINTRHYFVGHWIVIYTLILYFMMKTTQLNTVPHIDNGSISLGARPRMNILFIVRLLRLDWNTYKYNVTWVRTSFISAMQRAMQLKVFIFLLDLLTRNMSGRVEQLAAFDSRAQSAQN